MESPHLTSNEPPGQSRTPPRPAANRLHHGDNLAILRDSFADESIDLVYLDPPFNTNADYSLRPTKHASPKVRAFPDTWRWGPSAEAAYRELVEGPDSRPARTLNALR